MTHKCKCLDGFKREEIIYSVLHWVLSENENLHKRTYLSRYLMPIDVPMEYLLMQTIGNLKELLGANQGVARGGENLSVSAILGHLMNGKCHKRIYCRASLHFIEVHEQQIHGASVEP